MGFPAIPQKGGHSFCLRRWRISVSYGEYGLAKFRAKSRSRRDGENDTKRRESRVTHLAPKITFLFIECDMAKARAEPCQRREGCDDAEIGGRMRRRLEFEIRPPHAAPDVQQLPEFWGRGGWGVMDSPSVSGDDKLRYLTASKNRQNFAPKGALAVVSVRNMVLSGICPELRGAQLSPKWPIAIADRE